LFSILSVLSLAGWLLGVGVLTSRPVALVLILWVLSPMVFVLSLNRKPEITADNQCNWSEPLLTFFYIPGGIVALITALKLRTVRLTFRALVFASFLFVRFVFL
jgi:hypothetical protein